MKPVKRFSSSSASGGTSGGGGIAGGIVTPGGPTGGAFGGGAGAPGGGPGGKTAGDPLGMADPSGKSQVIGSAGAMTIDGDGLSLPDTPLDEELPPNPSGFSITEAPDVAVCQFGGHAPALADQIGEALLSRPRAFALGQS